MMRLPLRTLVYQATSLTLALFGSFTLFFVLFLLFGLSLLLLGQGDRIGQPWRALPFLLLQGLGSLLPLALLLGLALWERAWRQRGEGAALRSLALPPLFERLGPLLGLLPWVLLYAWILHLGTPLARQRLWASGPALLKSLQDPRDLSRAAALGLGLGISAQELDRGTLEKVSAYLPLAKDKALALRAEKLELRPLARGLEVRVLGGRVSRIELGLVEELADFGETRLFFDPGLARGTGPLPPEILSSPTLMKAVPELVRLAARGARGEPIDSGRLRLRYRQELARRRGKVSLLLATLLLGLGLGSGFARPSSLLAFLPLPLFLLLSGIRLIPTTLGPLSPWLPLALLLLYLLLPSPFLSASTKERFLGGGPRP